MNLGAWQWAWAAVGALLVGVSKGGLPGLGMLAVVVFAQVLPGTRQASGFLLPLLVFGDVAGVLTYRRHARWHHLWRLFPWTAAGVVAGYFAMGRIDDRQAARLIGGIVVALVALQVWRRRAGAESRERREGREEEHAAWFAPVIGVLAGFTTLVANAAGPLMAVYLLAMRLPKLEFVGTGAVFFLLLNGFKVPFMANLGLITAESFKFNLWLAPAVVAGTFAGRWLLGRIHQRWFENIALGLSAAGAVRLLW